MDKDLPARISVLRDARLAETVAAIEAGHIGLCLVVDEMGVLVTTLTDGDIRRGMLAGMTMATPLDTLVDQRLKTGRTVTARPSTPRRQLLDMMRSGHIRHIPIVDGEGRVVRIVTLSDLAIPASTPRALVMAGGFGRRMGELTADTPKPMLPVGDTPMLETLLTQLTRQGITEIAISVYYLGERIVEHFGDGARFGAQFTYVREDRPLGTAGAVSLLPGDDRPLLVINGDLMTTISFGALADFHRDSGAALTMAVRTYDQQVPFGVVECDGLNVRRIVEKPVVSHLVNAGIYMLEPRARALAPYATPLDMTELIDRLLAHGLPVAAFPVREAWLDVGRPDDYERVRGGTPHVSSAPA